jgi:hypothetical protein
MEHHTNSSLVNSLATAQPNVQQPEQYPDQSIGSQKGYSRKPAIAHSPEQTSFQGPTNLKGNARRKNVRVTQVRMACLMIQ